MLNSEIPQNCLFMPNGEDDITIKAVEQQGARLSIDYTWHKSADDENPQSSGDGTYIKDLPKGCPILERGMKLNTKEVSLMKLPFNTNSDDRVVKDASFLLATSQCLGCAYYDTEIFEKCTRESYRPLLATALMVIFQTQRLLYTGNNAGTHHKALKQRLGIIYNDLSFIKSEFLDHK